MKLARLVWVPLCAFHIIGGDHGQDFSHSYLIHGIPIPSRRLQRRYPDGARVLATSRMTFPFPNGAAPATRLQRHTNQAMLSFLSAHNDRAQDRPDSKVRPKSFSSLPSEDVLAWLDRFEMISSYHRWSDERKALEVRTLLENVAATWYVQQSSDVIENWVILQDLLVQNFAHQNSAQTVLQHLETLQQQAHEPVREFGVRLNQFLIRANPTMPEHVKLFFLWPLLRHDITRRARD